MACLMTKGRSRAVVVLLLCSLGGIGIKFTVARLAAPEHSAFFLGSYINLESRFACVKR
jgi:hypothetical protein